MLPYLDDESPPAPIGLPLEIRGDLERATGRALDHVRIDAGARGSAFAADHGTRAVTVGNTVSIGAEHLDPTSPDGRELLAHEVAHVVQADAPANPSSADPIADAEADADAFAFQFKHRGGAAGWTPLAAAPAQSALRAPSPKAAPKADLGTGAPYVATHIVHVVSAIYDRIQAKGLPQPHARLTWAFDGVPSALATAIEDYASVGDLALKQLMKLTPAADLRAIVERTRRDTVGAQWDPAVGAAIANAMLEPLDASIIRVGARVRVQIDASGVMPARAEVVASSPMDGLVADVMTRPGMVMIGGRAHGGVDDTNGKPFARGVREVEWEPAGLHDPKLWNVIRVTSPSNATAEDVAHTPLIGGEVMDGSEQAYRIHANPPFFTLPIETARLIPRLLALAPADVQARTRHGDLGPRIADGSALALSPVADEAVLAHAHAPTVGKVPASGTSLEHANLQLAFLWGRLAPWGVSHPLLAATAFVERRRQELDHDPHAAGRWQAALASMELVLFDASREATEVLDQLEVTVKPADAGMARPNVRVLEAYAHAAGVSHLPGEGTAALAQARRMRALIPVSLAEESIERARGELDGEHDARHEVGAESAQRQIDPRATDLATRAADLRLQVERGGKLDAEQADELQVDADEVAVRARLARISTLVKDVEQRARALGMNDSSYAQNLPTVFALANELDHKLSDWTGKLKKASDWRGPTAGHTSAQTLREQRRTAISQVSFAITAKDEVGQIGEWLNWAHKSIDDEALRNKLADLALNLGVMIVTGQVGGAIVTAMRGVSVGAELMAASREVGLGWQAAEVLIHAGLATGTQGALGGELSAKAFAENALMIGFSNAAMKPFEGLFANAAEVEADIGRTWQQLAKSGGKFVGQVALETATGAGASYLATGLMHQGQTGDAGGDWLEQGITIAASHFVGQRTKAMQERIYKASEAFGRRQRFESLVTKVEALSKRAAKSGVTSHEALEQLAETHRLLVEERQLYLAELHGDDPQRAKWASEALKATDHEAAANLVDAALHLSGLLPVVDGHVYEGTRAQIDAAIKHASATTDGVRHTYDANTGTHTLRVGEKLYTLHESQASVGSAHSTSGETETGSSKPSDAETSALAEEASPKTSPRADDGNAPRKAHAQTAAPGAAAMIDDLGASKVLPEQHAHVQGSVPIDAVLAMVNERAGLNAEQRAQQIDLLEALIAEATSGRKDLAVSDLSPSSVDIENGNVKAPRKVVIASVSGSLEAGLLNKMLAAKRDIAAAVRDGDSSARKTAEKELENALKLYRDAITMRKPGGAHYDASIKTGDEFFVRYNMIAGHDMTAADVAKRRASASQLGMQELRYSPEQKGLEAMREDAADLLANRPEDADVSLTYATTKKRTSAEDPRKNEQSQVVEFVKDWYDDPKSQRMFNGFENAGVEDVQMPPLTMWQGAAERAFRNAIVMREHLAQQLRSPDARAALAERLARITGKSPTEAADMLTRFQTGPYEAALAAAERRGGELSAQDDALRARRKSDRSTPWHPSLPAMDPATGQLIERFAGLSLEETASQTREMTEALNIWSAETGVHHGEVTTLGMTLHAGEQLLNDKIKPLQLLDQVDQALSMGTDRIGHGLILGIDPDVLVEKGRLEPAERDAFAARQRAVRDRARSLGVVIETNMSSNIEISNLTDNQHPAGRFVEDNMRVTVNTDDETVLGTDIATELHRVSEARGVTRNDLAAMILEGYRSRLGNRELAHRGRIKPKLKEALLRELPPPEASALATHLANYFHVQPAATPSETISRILDVALGM